MCFWLQEEGISDFGFWISDFKRRDCGVDGSTNSEASHRHKKQSGGRGQFGEVHLRVHHLPRDLKNEEELLEKALIAHAIMIRPGITKTT